MGRQSYHFQMHLRPRLTWARTTAMRDFLGWRVAPLVSSFCLLVAAAKPAAAQAPAAPAAAPQPAPQLAAPPPAPPGAVPAAAPAPGYPGGYPPPPPGYVYPVPAYGYPQPQMRSPDSVPYDGGPVPAGYHVEERPRRGLVIAGTIVLAVPYGLGLAVAGGQNFPNSTGWLIVPGIGPWLTLASRHKSGACSTGSSINDCVDTSVDDTTRT